MDNLTHTLVGAALAEAGLKRRTALGAATLMIGANFPDIDVIAVPLGVSFAGRRGITHGVLGLVVLPFVLAGIMWLWDRHVRRRLNTAAAPADPWQLVLLAGLSILTHPTLDYMNTYGMRWLMPFVDRWFYADGLFIIDLWIWMALALGILLSRRRLRSRAPAPDRPSAVGLGFLVAYTIAMLAVTQAGRMSVRAARPDVAHAPRAYMVSPPPLVPWRREVVVDEGDRYRFGEYTLGRGLTLSRSAIEKNDAHPLAARARELPESRTFLRWARYPLYRVMEQDGGAFLVRISDARYTVGGGWASITVRVPFSSTATQ